MNIPAVKSELSLFQPRITQSCMEKANWMDYHPISSSYETGTTMEFVINETEKYLDLNDSMLVLNAKITKKGKALTAAEKPNIFPCNMLLSSLFSDVILSINDTVVESSNNMYPYKCMLNALLNFDENMIGSQLEASGYTEEAEMEAANKERGDWLHEGIELAGPLMLDLFCQSQYFPSGNSLRIKLIRKRLDFVLKNHTADSNDAFQIVISGARLMIRGVSVNPAVKEAHLRGLKKNNITFNLNKTELSTFVIPKTSMSHTQENLYRGVLPKMVIVALVRNDAFEGHKKLNPFNFNHFNLNHISLFRDGESVQPLTPDFSRKYGCTREYMSLLQNLELFNKNESNAINLEKFRSGGGTIFAFNLTPDLSVGGGQEYKNANLRLDIRFSRALAEPVNVIIYCIRDGKLQITKEGSIFKE